jgi:hypothetical protein
LNLNFANGNPKIINKIIINLIRSWGELRAVNIIPGAIKEKINTLSYEDNILLYSKNLNRIKQKVIIINILLKYIGEIVPSIKKKIKKLSILFILIFMNTTK